MHFIIICERIFRFIEYSKMIVYVEITNTDSLCEIINIFLGSWVSVHAFTQSPKQCPLSFCSMPTHLGQFKTWVDQIFQIWIYYAHIMGTKLLFLLETPFLLWNISEKPKLSIKRFESDRKVSSVFILYGYLCMYVCVCLSVHAL